MRTALVPAAFAVAALASPTAAQDASGGDVSDAADVDVITAGTDGLPDLVMVVRFAADEAVDISPEAFATLAGRPFVAQLDLSAAEGPRGTLVFRSVGAFENWRRDERGEFYETFGGADAVEEESLAFRPDLLAISDPEELLAGLKTLSIAYVNTGNDSKGDADIDAVTVVCPGLGAECSPSN
ncbi:hypothetical protein BCF33_0067 [Hasllibacter halocynthiae]|uniref:Uncharacterized protein n=1 Tax=Hasllibacter halocynthiae TaxID=595589 RepID=A0A2T0X6C5_9RHOB|nr:hypothetical protein [Hasllibacter halocynthiae]PRY94477.1 hypothetical protein BCF33_0067 [Hasllibacter halocynthiae]